MKLKVIFVWSALITFLCVPRSFSQTRQQLQAAAGDAIDGILKTQLGVQYESVFVIDVDSVVENTDLYINPVEDAYGTLKHCFIFIGGRSANTGNFVGVYKEGIILWRSDTTIFGWQPDLFAVQDLNRSGKVDLVFESGVDQSSELWIFSWDGHSGNRINAVDSRGESVLQSVAHSFSLFDANGDGIIEIRDGNVEDGSETWSWNGSEYGSWPDTPHLPSTTLWPRNNIDILVRCAVNGSKTCLEFDYTVENKPISLQKLYDMRIWGRCDSVRKNLAPVGWQAAYNPGRRGDFFSYWCNNPTGRVWRIPPGKTASGFATLACGLPAIVQYDAQGYNHFPNYRLMTNQQLDELEKKDETDNSIHGLTIAPVNSPSPFIPLNFLDALVGFTTQSRSLGWIKDQTTANKYLGYFNSAKTNLQQNNIASTRATLQQVLQDANVDSTANITSEAYALIRYNTEYLLSQLPAAPISGCNVKLINSTGARLTTGSLQYYEGSWKDAINNNDGTFTINTTAKTLNLRMTYEYCTQTKSNVTIGPDTVAFQTVNAQIKLQDSKGNAIDTGSVQYYAGAWRTLGTTTNGIANKELLPVSYSFRMTYAYASNDKQQDINANSTVIFQTVNAAVQLQNSQGSLMDQGTVQYYSGAWRDFGTTASGVAKKELLPNNYSFRMTYAFASKDKQQDIGTNSTVVFQTVNAAVQLQNTQGNLIDQGIVQYYSGAWRDLGTTTNGVANKELLPNNYSFRMTYAYASKDKQQDLSSNPVVVFQTVNATVQLQSSQGALIDQGTVQYYSGAWRDFGTTTGGVANKELLPNNYSFRIMYEYVSLDKSQDLSTNSTVSFSTVLCTIRVKNSQSQPVDGALASYYSGAWRQIGTTVNGEVTKELLPANLTFRVTYSTTQQDKTQNLSTSNVVEFTIGP